MGKGVGLTALAWLAVAVPAAAFDGEGKYIVHGTGQAPCAEWTADRMIAGAGAWQQQQWLLGYLTAYNEWVGGSADIAGSLGADGVFSWVDDFCGRDRTRSLGAAVQDLVRTQRAASEEFEPEQ
ncbi:MAG TPA: hypothetical protein VGA50_05655 [Kiloniellales bacterium]